MSRNSFPQGDPLVSIRCMVYNHEPFLRQCLDGFVMQQTTFPFEAIVHDDASTDGSAAIIREYAEKYPDIIKPIYETENQYSKRDGSIARIMDVAMHPNSKYIALCEGDDYWTDPNKLQMQVDFLENHPDYTMCFHQAKTVLSDTGEETDKNPALNFRSVETRDYYSTELFQKWMVPTASIVRRRNLYYRIKYPDNSPYGDIYVVLRCAELGKVRGFDRMMSVYRIHSAGVTNSPGAAAKYIKWAPEHFVALMKNFPKLDKRVMRMEIANRYWIRARFDKKLFFHDMLMSFKYDFRVPIIRILMVLGLKK